MEQQDAVGKVVGDRGARKIERVVDGTREYVYEDDQLVLFIDRDPKYQLDLGEFKPKVDVDNPYVKTFLEAALRRILAEREKELLDLKGPCPNVEGNIYCSLHFAHSGPCNLERII